MEIPEFLNNEYGHADFGFPVQDYVFNRITLTPEKFGQVGSFCRSTLQATPTEDHAYMLDQMLVRFTMQVISGKTVTEHPEVTFTWFEYASWWDHLKDALWKWRAKMDKRWMGETDLGVPPWMVLLWPFLVLFPKWVLRHPGKQTPKIAKTTVDFRQSILYPEFDHVPAEFGRPVIYESLEVNGDGAGFGLGQGTYDGRFMNKHEIVSEIYRDPEMFRGYPGGAGSEVMGVLLWLERKGVNVDQLVKRR